MATVEEVTYCRICEPLCGMVATVEDGRLTKVRPDPEHPLPARVTDEVKRGTIAVPHGWGHQGGWRLAAAAGGANVNLLSSSDPEDLERLAGMACLNGIPVRLEPVGAQPVNEPATPVEAPA